MGMKSQCFLLSPGADSLITHNPIRLDEYYRQLLSEDCGGIVVFVGTVRNENEGVRVEKLEYECHETIAENRLREIEAEIRRRWDVRQVVLVHRVGVLRVGEASVLVGVAAPHREDAFAAARFGIERIKDSVPIWKKEHGAGQARWLKGTVMRNPSESEG